ncbi:MAG: hypothetical protein OEM18_07420, partial [Nitrosopumilus sp.]|nr:hypothetical protein [Nitrosopumilus sp.]
SEPCPYCSGVRVRKEGHALCINCGKEPEEREIPKEPERKIEKAFLEEALEKKLGVLSEELNQESNHEKQQEILKSINSIIETIERIKKKQ